ncbi:cold-shock protein [Paenibacillus gallinarum]|uniref:Cold-shock protein n=1 Tax=Paenibacillus gallinarum TaxID=2762232 RepID=A0ABR8T6B8_9BACL|nr:cold-shock protein [Paenibacillus gallinarum]MBD7970829.1 cold-shock protein [Paenibacillus gallinarum]
MYNSRRKPMEDVPMELTAIWSCSNDGCKGWMRDNFVFSVVPVCPQCQSSMIKDEKMLATVTNTSPNQNKK